MKKKKCVLFIFFILLGYNINKAKQKDQIIQNNNSNYIELERTNQDTTISKIISDTLPWSVRMAESTMNRYPEAWKMENRNKPKWSYSHCVTLTGFEALWKKTGNTRYYSYVKDYVDTCVREDGSVINYRLEEYNIDRVNGGKLLFELYEETSNEKYKKALLTFREQMKTHPRTSENGFWHKKKYPWQMWLDGLYMGCAFLAEFAYKFNEPELFDDVAHQIILMEQKARDEKTGLLYHGWDEKRQQSWADPETGLSKNFWGRGMGWYAMAIVDVLDYLPKEHPKYNEVVNIFNRLSEAITKVQDDSTGLWYQVLDQGNREGNYFEATAATMFVYSMLKGVRKGYLDEKYLDVAIKGYNGIIKHLIKIDPDGEIYLMQCNYGAGLSDDRDGTYEYYISERVGPDDPKGIGPFILASLEMEEYLKD